MRAGEALQAVQEAFVLERADDRACISLTAEAGRWDVRATVWYALGLGHERALLAAIERLRVLLDRADISLQVEDMGSVYSSAGSPSKQRTEWLEARYRFSMGTRT